MSMSSVEGLNLLHWIFAQNMVLVVDSLCYSSFHSVGCLLGLWSINLLFRNYTRAYYTRLRCCFMYVNILLCIVCHFPRLVSGTSNGPENPLSNSLEPTPVPLPGLLTTSSIHSLFRRSAKSQIRCIDIYIPMMSPLFYFVFFSPLPPRWPTLSATSAICNVKNTWTIPEAILMNWLHSVGPKTYTSGDKTTISDAAINNPHTQNRAFTEKVLVLQMGIASAAKLRIVMHELWTKNQKSASCVVPGLWGEYRHPRAVVGMVTTKTRRLSHRVLETCCCRIINYSVLSVK